MDLAHLLRATSPVRWAAALLVVGCWACDDGGGDEAAGPSAPAEQRPLDLVRASPFPRLVVEVDVVRGEGLRTATADRLVEGLEALVDKPGGVVVTSDGEMTSRGADHAWTFDELKALAAEHDDLEVPADTIKIHLMVLDGRSDRDEGESKILGLAWENRHVALFSDTVESLCVTGGGGPAARLLDRLCDESERAILLHELGHVLGLVDNGLEMVTDHKDAAHGAHSNNDRCLMYWAYEGPRVVDLIRAQLSAGGDVSLGFDEACLADLEAARQR